MLTTFSADCYVYITSFAYGRLFFSDNRRLLGETDGVDILLGQLAPFKRHDPSNAQETEMMENLFNALCSALLFNPNRAKFLKVSVKLYVSKWLIGVYTGANLATWVLGLA